MSHLNRPRLLLGGFLAGLVIDSIQYLLDSFVFSDNWDAVAKFINPAEGKPPHVVTLSATLILVLLQFVGLAAGLLAVRFYARKATHKRVTPWPSATASWALTYGSVCTAAAVLRLIAADSAKAPMTWLNVALFALSGWCGCVAGTSFGAWIYRESEAVAQRAAERAAAEGAAAG